MQPKTTGKTALVTGAASGIGRELAKLFAQDGYRLVLVDRDSNGLNQLANELSTQHGTQTSLIAKDLADPKAPDEIYARRSGEFIDVLVNNAGFGTFGRFATETDLQTELALVQTNATALMHLTKLYLNDMVGRNEGKILMLGSEVSVSPSPMQAVYGATKAFIKSFSESIRNELKDTNVTVTVLMPGGTNTNFFRTAGAAHTKMADPEKTADPADVAKVGYDALMKGQDHVVEGFMNKLRVALAHVLPDPLVSAMARQSTAPRDDAQQQKQKQLITTVAIGAAVIGGLWLLNRNQTRSGISTYDKTKYRYKAGKAKFKAANAIDSVTDSVKGAYHNAKAEVEKALA